MSDYIQIARLIGHHNVNKPEMVKNDFYTILMKDQKRNIGLRKKSKSHLPVFKSDDVDLDYLCSDLVRFCLALYKNNQHNDAGEMSLIPKEPIPISQELKEYIEEFLPDYYGIRDTVK